jgi:hypothetical protein
MVLQQCGIATAYQVTGNVADGNQTNSKASYISFSAYPSEPANGIMGGAWFCSCLLAPNACNARRYN